MFDNSLVRPMTYDFDAEVTSTVDDSFKYKKFTAGQNFKNQAGLR